MDISEYKDVKLTGDKLDLMFTRQTEAESQWAKIEGFPERLVFGKLENLHVPETCAHINDKIFWRMVQEINEAVVALRNAKQWRQSAYFTDVNEYLDEISDIMIYFINACLASGISAELLTQSVLKKIRVNIKRIESKY